MTIGKLLVANRGEIACRVMRTAKALGLPTVAVYSDADANSLHVRMADEAVRIGPPPASDSYLCGDALIAAARQTGADALHPGYGFLAENAAFAADCTGAGLAFVGPPAEAIRAMGDKAEAKRRMEAAGVQCIPGWHGTDQSPDKLRAAALALGFPLLIKAIAGGGGRGMRRVDDAAAFDAALGSARREARSAFGDGTVMLERLIGQAAHVEIQVFADTKGNVVHMFERDCSAQRRRQKIVEEAPSPIVTPQLRAAMGGAAVAAARAIGYVGAGTVEFIVDAERDFYFLEMNTRLQVEHPVTEMITGQDLVAWQLAVAAGEPLPLTQDEIAIDGHAIEARLYAEDPYADFAPQTGTLAHFVPAPNLRYDMGVGPGDRVTPFYDALLGKVIAHGRTRDEALARLVAGLRGAPLLGVRTNQAFLAELVDGEAFRGGAVTTATLDEWAAAASPLLSAPEIPADVWALAALLFVERSGGDWFYTSGHVAFDLGLCADDAQWQARVQRDRDGVVSVSPTGASAASLRLLAWDGAAVRYEIDGAVETAQAIWAGDVLHLAAGGHIFSFVEPSPLAAAGADVDPARITAPVAGVVAKLEAEAGQSVAEGEPLVYLEAMKMEIPLAAQADARVSGVHARVGQQVSAGAVLIDLEYEGRDE